MNKNGVFYNKISAIYPLIDLFLKSHKKLLATSINQLLAGTLLDVGCGHGALVPFANKHQYTGIDCSTKMIEVAKKKNPNAAFLLADACNLPFQNCVFDYIVFSHVLSTIPQYELALKEAMRVLKPNGKIIILNHFNDSKKWKLFKSIFLKANFNFHFSTEHIFKLLPVKYCQQVNIYKDFKLIIFTAYE